MNLAVKLYKDEIDKPKDIPDLWPSQVLELGESSDLPDETWILMTIDNYNLYIIQYKSLYETWKASIVPDNSLQNAKDGMIFGQTFIAELGAEPEVINLDTEQMIQLVTLTGAIQLMLMTGALGTALISLENTDFTSVLSNDLINKYINKLKQYLGVE